MVKVKVKVRSVEIQEARKAEAESVWHVLLLIMIIESDT